MLYQSLDYDRFNDRVETRIQAFLRSRLLPFPLLLVITQLVIQFLKVSRKERMKSSNPIIPETSLELIILIITIRRKRGHETEGIIQLKLDCMIQLNISTFPISWVPGSLSLGIQAVIPPFLRFTGRVSSLCIAKLHSRFLRSRRLPLSRPKGQILTTPFPDTASLVLIHP